MGNLDLWTLLTGIAGLLSFLLAIWDKFPQWKKYLIPVGCFLAGFAFGRVSPIVSQGMYHISNSPQLASNMLIIIILVGVALTFAVLMIKKNEIGFAYIGIILILSMVTPTILKSYSEATFKIPPTDYLKLANVYEQKQDFDDAIKYLNKYLEVIDDDTEKKQIHKKISQLKQKQIEDTLSDK